MARINFHLYLVTDRHQTGERPLPQVIDEAGSAGLPAVQLREKDLPTRPFLSLAQEIRRITQKRGTKLFVNSRIDVAHAVGADGVHLPSDGLPVEIVRRAIGDRMLLGVSCHSVETAKAAEQNGADFVLLGPIYPTASKERYGSPLGVGVLEKARSTVNIPIFAIGGIKREKLREISKSGVYGVAMISTILSSDNIEQAVNGIQEEINRCTFSF